MTGLARALAHGADAGRHIGYLSKYLTKSISQAAGLNQHTTDAHRDHARRLHAELRVRPCSPRCALWLLYGIQAAFTAILVAERSVRIRQPEQNRCCALVDYDIQRYGPAAPARWGPPC